MSSKFKERLEAERAAKRTPSEVPPDLVALVNHDWNQGHGWYNNSQVTPAPVREGALQHPSTAVPPNWNFKPEEIPDVYDDTPGEQALTNAIKNLPVTHAYRMWIGKGEPEIRYAGQVESIMIRCPFPDHYDENPSAWCNSAKNTWYCAKCEYGGDIYDLAAIKFGYQVPGYKKNGQFPSLRADMARALGIQMVRGVNGQEYAVSAETGNTAPPQVTTPPPVAQIPPQAPHVANGAVHRAFQIPGLKPVSLNGTVPSDEPRHSPVVDATPTPTVPESPVAPPTMPVETAPPQVAMPPTVPQDTARVHPVFQIPGVQAISVNPAAPTTTPAQVSAPTAPQVLAPPPPPPPPVPIMTVVEPDAELLHRYGLNEEGDDTGDSGFEGIKLNWHEITPESTFLSKYMNLTTKDWPAEEYHYFSGLAALSVAVGHDVTLFDSTPVRANFNVCLLGPSGDGKSIAQGYMTDLVDRALPHDFNDPFSKGVKRVSNPASAEYLVKEFVKNIEDPGNPKKILGTMPVRGVVDFAELATLMKRANAQGSTLTQFLIQFFDGRESVRTGSITNGSDVAKSPFATVVSTTQPRALREILTQEHIDNGFINRWVFATGQSRERPPIGAEVLDIDPLVPALKDVFGWAGQLGGSGKPFVLPYSPAARDATVDFVRSVIYPAMQRDSTGLIARLDLYFKKLVLLHTINMQQLAVPVEAVQWSIKMYDYLTATYDTLDKAVHHNMNAELREAILKVILSLHKKNGVPPSLKQLGTKIGHRKWNDKQILECVQALVKLGYVEEVPPPPGPGRKTMRYVLVDGE